MRRIRFPLKGSLKMMEMEEVLDYLYSKRVREEQEVGEDRKGGSGATAHRAALADKDQDPFPAKHSGNHGASRAGEVSNDGAFDRSRSIAQAGTKQGSC